MKLLAKGDVVFVLDTPWLAGRGLEMREGTVSVQDLVLTQDLLLM